MAKLKPNAKFDTTYSDIALRLKAAGFSDKDLAYALGVCEKTIDNWKNQYPTFKDAVEKGRETAVKMLIATAIRAACGYNYEETEQEKRPDGTMGKTIIRKKYQRPDTFLLTFMLINLAPDQFRNTKYLVQDRKSLDVTVVADLEVEQIQRISGKLAELVETRKKAQNVECDKMSEMQPSGNNIS